jgi:hypothetical protein
VSEYASNADPADGDEHNKEPRSIDELRVDVMETREELGETVAALAQRVDVKARVQASGAEAVERARDKARKATAAVESRWPAAAATVRRSPQATAAAVGGVLVLVWLVARRRGRTVGGS